MKNRFIQLADIPQGMPRQTDFTLVTEELASAADGELLLKILYISVDPYLRAKMAGGHQPALYAGDVMYSRAVAEVVVSNHPGFAKCDHVIGFLEWKDHVISNGSNLTIIDSKETSLSSYLSVLGSTGLSAYFALGDIGKPKPGETIVVSGAAGAVGSIAGQIGKIMGCRVIGIVGTAAKEEFITGQLNFDAAINYKTTTNLAAELQQLCPGGIDVYFDNVGGPISDAVIANMNNYGKVVVCGSIASYNSEVPEHGPRILPAVVYKKLLIQGFLINNYKARFAEGIQRLRQWIGEGRLHYAETVIDGLEQAPSAFIGLFEGKNEGKMIVKVS